MQYTKDMALRIKSNLKIKKCVIENMEDLYMYMVIIVSVIVLTLDFYIIKQFLDIIHI